jgi:hypothetical protein
MVSVMLVVFLALVALYVQHVIAARKITRLQHLLSAEGIKDFSDIMSGTDFLSQRNNMHRDYRRLMQEYQKTIHDKFVLEDKLRRLCAKSGSDFDCV